MFKRLKQVGQALSPDAIRQGLAASREAMAHGGHPSPEQLAAMPPEARARYEQARAKAQADLDAALAEATRHRALFGPAGERLYGPLPGAHIETDWRGRARSAAAPPPTAVADPAAQAAHERAQRDEARTPYLSPDCPRMTFTRIATEPSRPLDGLATWLGTSGLAGRPDLVYGVYRVPDHVRGGFFFGRKPALVEWTVVHTATTALPAASPPAAVSFDARERWVARRPGDPSVLDEDLALDYLRAADLGPEQCLGVAREVAVDAGGGAEGHPPYALIGAVGVVALHPSRSDAGTFERMRAARPLPVPPVSDVHVEVLNWRDVARVVAPRSDRRFLVPSPFPYLPSTAQELLEAYLRVVGVLPADCYSTQVTVGAPSSIIGGGAHVTTTEAEAEVAADGQVRQRLRGGSLVVVAYRDSPVYAEGRQRWAAYQREVLQADLSRGVSVRPPVVRQSRLDRGALGGLLRGVEVVGELVDGEGRLTTLFDKVPDFRYCWPPVD